MITSVDTNVLLDVFVSDAPHHSQSQEWLIGAYDRGAVLVCDVVYAELVPAFGDRSALDGALSQINATISPLDTAIAYEAGLRWSRYRQAGGPRTRIMSDFLIGAHAVARADTFLTRDRGFYATYFPELQGQ
ncbi:MAG: PIN domain-containing protein [Caldilineaceae bacterium SB0662_bin_9]|uniref:PIN domain-containing protein n=1 Tax=Caldilineaceae bacterium SB0662_bin_9 TaxID=2605258 RepID=A0A6B1DSL8_9CHLR|nr:type II toxin-antitoxin system VapC family toxin [Caldilineaceae bacterium]MXZ40590.1 PIN domain-containing protein [Caldilineaceae bacterium SB0666_bin_21]MYD89384.1 PIN domain-containing protein [Caldilineaceae bacterium SB0662_bin_9]